MPRFLEARRRATLAGARSRGCLVAGVLFALIVVGCKHRLGWVVVPSEVDAGPAPDAGPTPRPADDEALARWSIITPGPCSLSPGMPVWSSSSGDNAPPLPRGRYCFASLLVRTFARPGVDSALAPCQLEAAAAQSRLLPDEDDEVRLVEQPVLATERPAWDRVVSTVAHCAPRRAPDRCSCPYSGDASEECVPALSGDLIAFGDRHACVGRRGGQELWCWGDASAFGSGPTRMVPPTRPDMGSVPPEALEEIEANRRVTCVRGASGRIACLAAGPATVVGRSPTEPVRAGELSLGGDVGCALGVIEGNTGIGVFCRRFTSPSLEVALPDAEEVDSISVGDGLACIRRGRDVSCARTDTDAWNLEPIEGQSFLTIQLGGSYACGQSVDRYEYRCSPIVDGALSGAVLTTGASTSLSVSSDSVCITRAIGIACANWSDHPSVDADLRDVLTSRGHLLSGRAGPGIVCGTPEEGDGSLVCRSVGDRTIGRELLEVGSRYSAAGSDVICPGS